MPASIDFFTAARVNGIMQGLTDPRLLPGTLTWNQRIPDVPAADGEITAKFVGTLTIADLIANDAKAVIYKQGRFQYETNEAPNIKMGIGLNQEMIQTLDRIQSSGGIPNDDVGLFNNYMGRLMANVKYGVELRKEVLKLAMLLDGYSYDRLGIKMQNLSWGMYSDLKVTPGTAWGTAAGVPNSTATPITDINTIRRVAMQRYGINLNRATMSTAALQMAAGTTEFANQVKLVYAPSFGAGVTPAIPLQSDMVIKNLMQNIIAGTTQGAFTIEIDDRRYWAEDNAGALNSWRIHPANQVLLTATENDGNANAYDFANGVVTESRVASMLPSGVFGNIPVGRGPIAYATPADVNLNPPGVVVWGVARGFPRKHLNQASGVLNVGAFTDTISTAVPAVL
jgi:hypothetical protein